MLNKRTWGFLFLLILIFTQMVLIPAAKEITLWTFYGGVLGQVFTEIIKEDFVLHCKMKLN